MTTGQYPNDNGLEVPENKILVIPNNLSGDGFYKEIIEPLKGQTKRDWFNSHYYYCLPLIIGNQYGFIIKSVRDFEIFWDGTERDATITFLNNDNQEKQIIKTGFNNGVITVQNHFHLKTPPGINLMTIQPPNMFIKGTSALTGVIETDQLRRDFTFNFKVTVPNLKITIQKGDPLGAFIPIPRQFVEKFDIDLATNYFSAEVLENELNDGQELGRQRGGEDREKPHASGRKYFNGVHAFGESYRDHQKKIR